MSNPRMKVMVPAAAAAIAGLVSPLIARADLACTSQLKLMSAPETSHVTYAHIPQRVNRMTDLGTLSGDKVLPVMFALPLNNESELDQRIAEMYRPGSPSFHHFMTPELFRERYAPTQAQVEHERKFLEANGIAVDSVSENGVFIRARASIDTLDQVFKTEVHQYLGKDGKIYFAPAYDVQIPNESRITSVIGLHNLVHLQRHLLMSKKKGSTTEGSAPGGGLAPADIVKAYKIPSGATGAGQTIALFELDAYDSADIAAYAQQFNLGTPNVQNIFVDGADTQTPGDGADEVTLDIEMALAIAPQAKILVYEGPIADASGAIQNFEEGYIDLIQKIAADDLAPQVSSSWGAPEAQFAASDLQAENTVFKQMAAQGQSFFAAAGDDGADDNGSSLSVDNPASQPYVVAVGGTTLTISSDGSWKKETTWNGLSSQNGAGGGGISTVWSIPSWQQNAIKGAQQASSKMRNVPDVALNANPATGYGIYVLGSWQVVGGTSAAAPLWAAFNALVNQQRASAGLSNTGFLSPALYAIGEGANYDSSFYDITSGTNGTGSDSFAATKGFDDATGWGSFKAEALIRQLSQ